MWSSFTSFQNWILFVIRGKLPLIGAHDKKENNTIIFLSISTQATINNYKNIFVQKNYKNICRKKKLYKYAPFVFW